MQQRNPLTDLALIAVFAALIAAASWTAIPIPGGVPLTLQVLACALVGLVLGPWRGVLAVLLWLVVGFAGLPVFANFKSGLGVLSGPSAGYLLGFVLDALVVGLLAQVIVRRTRGGAQAALLVLAAVAGCLLLLYPCGIAGMMRNAHLGFGRALAVGLGFLPWDLAKVIVAGLIAATVHRAFPALLGRRVATTA